MLLAQMVSWQGLKSPASAPANHPAELLDQAMHVGMAVVRAGNLTLAAPVQEWALERVRGITWSLARVASLVTLLGEKGAAPMLHPAWCLLAEDGLRVVVNVMTGVRHTTVSELGTSFGVGGGDSEAY